MQKSIYLLDTNIISEMAKPNPNTKVIEKIEANKEKCAISSTTWNELLYGVYKMPECKKRDYLLSFLLDYVQENFPLITYDSHCAWIHGDIRARLDSIGREAHENSGYADSEIASIAISNQMILVTRNTKHFEPIQAVDSVFYMENWFD